MLRLPLGMLQGHETCSMRQDPRPVNTKRGSETAGESGLANGGA